MTLEGNYSFEIEKPLEQTTDRIGGHLIPDARPDRSVEDRLASLEDAVRALHRGVREALRDLDSRLAQP